MSFDSKFIVKTIYGCNGKDTRNPETGKKYNQPQIFIAFFSSFYKHRFAQEERNREKEAKKANKIFYQEIITFDKYSVPDKEDMILFNIDKGNVGNYLNGKKSIPSEIQKFYISKDEREKELADGLKQTIPIFGGMVENAVQKIHEELEKDKMIPEFEKNTLNIMYQKINKNKARIAEYFAACFCCAFRNECRVISNQSIDDISKLVLDNVPEPCIDFGGRENELCSLHDSLGMNGKVFLYGVPGIGKSELVKAYANIFRKEFNGKIIYIFYSGDLKKDIANMQFSNDKTKDDENTRFYNHIKYLKRLKENNLLIIDNFNSFSIDDDVLEEVLKFDCKVLITSTRYFSGVHSIEIKRIEKLDFLYSFFEKKYLEDLEEKKIINNIIELLSGHTFALRIVASLVNDCWIEPASILEKLLDRNLLKDISDELEFRKDNKYKEATYQQHINALFEIYSLNADQKNILKQFCVLPRLGIEGVLLKELLQLKNMNAVNQLIKMGFIQKDSNNVLSIHSLSMEYALSNFKPTLKDYYSLLNNVLERFRRNRNYLLNYQGYFTVIKNCIRFIKKDDIEFYINYLYEVSWFAESYYDTSLKKMIFSELKSFEQLDFEFNDKSIAAKLYYYFGIHEHNLKKRLEYYLGGLLLLETDGNDDNTHLLFNITIAAGNTFFLLNEYEQAFFYYQMGLVNCPSDDNSFYTAVSNCVIVALKLNKGQEAVEILKPHYEMILSEKGEYNQQYISIIELLAIIQLYYGRIDLAEQLLSKAFIIYSLLKSGDINLLRAKAEETATFYKFINNNECDYNIDEFLYAVISEIEKNYSVFEKNYLNSKIKRS